MDQLSNLNDISISLLGLAPLLLAGVILVLLLKHRIPINLSMFSVSTRTYVLAMVMAVAGMTVLCSFIRFSVFPPGGSDNYFPRALNIVRNGVVGVGTEPGVLFPPGYSFLMIPAAWLMGESKWVFFSTNISLLVCTSIAVAFLLRKMGMLKGEANLVSLLLFLYPNRLLATLLPFSDIPFSLVYLCAFLLILLAASHPAHKVYPVAGGLIAGAAALIRATGVPLLLPLLLVLWRVPVAAVSPMTPESLPRLRMRNIALFMTGALVVLMPWSIRNLTLFGEIIPISSNFGYNIAIGNNPEAGVTHNGYIDSLARDPATWIRFGADTSWNVAQIDRFLLRKGMEYIGDHPGSFLVRGVGKVFHTFAADASSFGMNQTYGNLSTLVFSLAHGLQLGPLATGIAYAVYATGYRALFVLNNTFYYVTLLLLFVVLIRHWPRWSGPELAYVAAVLITCCLVFVLFGNSRFKEPIPTLTLVLLAVEAVKDRSVLEGKKA
jgi:hypothetical protein